MIPKRRKTAAWLWWLLPITMVVGWFMPVAGIVMLGCMLAPVVISAFRGRHWCGWLCPRGSFFDYVMSRVSPKRPAPRWLRSAGFRIGLMVVLMSAMAIQVALAWPNAAQIGMVFIRLLIITTVVGIILAVVYTPRTWCSFCPMGTMASWLAKGKRPLMVASSCVNCRACVKVCPMDIEPHQQSTAHGDCIKCGQCVERCPVKSLSW